MKGACHDTWLISNGFKVFCYISLYACMYTCMHVTATIWKSQDKESVLTFLHLHPREQNEVIDLASKHLYLLGQLMYKFLCDFKSLIFLTLPGGIIVGWS